jgi:hypothetical protein
MKTLKDYIAESETWEAEPVHGDDFDIELAPDHNFESYVMESIEDGVVLYADETALSLLESYGCFEEDLDEEIRRYGAVGSNRAMGYTLGEANEELDEGRMKDIATMASDANYMRDDDFLNQYGMSKEAFKMKYKDLLPKSSTQPKDPFGRMMELAGCGRMEEDNSDLLPKEIELAPVGALEEEEIAINEVVDDLDEGQVKHMMHKDAERMTRDDFVAKYGAEHGEFWDNINEELSEAEYQGRDVPLGKPMRGDVKKFKVYVKDPATGNIKKVNFGHGGTSAKRAGQKTMKIKKSNPARRKSFRARHNCDNPGPRTKARYWSCRAW